MSGGTPSKVRNDFWGGDIPWVSCKDMKTERIDDTQDHLTPLGAQNGTRLVPADTILFVVRGMILAREFPVAMTKRAVTFNQDLKAAKPAPFIDNKFLFQWLRANTYEILGRVDEAGHGTTRIQTDRLLSLPISVPPLPVQQRIAGILSAYDELIENSQRRIRILESMARALYREWFVHFRFPGHESVPRVPSPLGEIPQGWAATTLGTQLAALESGKRPKGGIRDVEDGVPSIGAENINGIGHHDFAGEKFIPRGFFEEMRKGVVHDRDVAIYKDGAYIGKSSYFRDGFPHLECCVNEHVFLLRSNGARLK
jgi:type I restriction enzyme S subunit